MIQDPNAPLLSELRWFIRQRWLAGSIVTIGTLLSVLWVDWTSRELQILLVGVLILSCNLVYWVLFRKFTRWIERPAVQRRIAWMQLVVDLICLTYLVVLTNGVYSPVLGLFVLHMIFASLLLQSSRHMPYLSWVLAVVLVSVALRLTGQWPETTLGTLVGVGWAGALLMTIYFTTHITNNVRANHDRTRAVLDAAADGLLTIDHAGRIELANPSALDMFGYTTAQITCERIDKLFPRVDIPGVCLVDEPKPDQSQSVPDGDDELGDYGVRRDGSIFPIEVSVSKMNLGANEAFTAVIRDITEREHNEAQLRGLNLELEKHQEQLVHNEKMIAVGRMAAGIAHEIANPLANIDGLIQLVERNPARIGPETSSQLREQVARITEIVRQLKDYAHPGELDWCVMPADELVKSAIDMIRFDRRKQQVVVAKDMANPCCHLHISHHAIQQVLVNLIVNALDAVEDAETPQVGISSACTGDGFCTISIHDNGVGISEKHQELIFEPFFTTKPLGKGTGLGLSISYNLVQMNGGRLEVESTLGEGTTVSVILPVSQCQC